MFTRHRFLSALLAILAFPAVGAPAHFAQRKPLQLKPGTRLPSADVSHYCNEGPQGCRVCCGEWAPLNRTTSGRPPQAGVSVAAPPGIPFGTWVLIEGVGPRRVDDRTSPKFRHRWDLFIGRHPGAHREALVLGLKLNRRIVVLPDPMTKHP